MDASSIKRSISEKVRHYDRAAASARDLVSRLERDKQRAHEVIRDGYESLAESRILSPLGQNLPGDVSALMTKRRLEAEALGQRITVSQASLNSREQDNRDATATLKQRLAAFEAACASDARLAELASELRNVDVLRDEVADVKLLNDIKQRIGEYDKNPLFVYLLSRREQSARRYNPLSRLVKRIDRALEKRFNFAKNVANYELLIASRTACGKIDQINTRLLKRARAKMEDRKREIADEIGVTVMQTQLQATSRMLSQMHDDHKKLIQTKELFIANKDPLFLNTVNALANHLWAEETVLVAKSSAESDMVEQIRQAKGAHDHATKRLKEAQKELESTLAQRDKAQRFEHGLSSTLQSSDRYSYDSSLDVNALLIGYLAGRIDLGGVQSAVRSSENEIASSSSSYDSYGSSSSFGGSSSHSTSSSFGGDSSSSSSDSGYSSSDSF